MTQVALTVDRGSQRGFPVIDGDWAISAPTPTGPAIMHGVSRELSSCRRFVVDTPAPAPAHTILAYIDAHGELGGITLLGGMRARALAGRGTTLAAPSPKDMLPGVADWGRHYATTGAHYDHLSGNPRNLSWCGGTASAVVCLEPPIAAPSSAYVGYDIASASPVKPTPRPTAARMIDEAADLSGLTREELAPLSGVTRRSLSSWYSGETISARKETRLRSLVEALRAVSTGDAKTTRERLLNRPHGGLRLYDLLAEGRFDVAVQLATSRPAPAGVKPVALPPVPPPPAPVLARLSLREDIAIEPHGRVNLKRSRRLKR